MINWKKFILAALCITTTNAWASLLPIEQDTIHVFKKVSPYVVNVHPYKQSNNLHWQPQKILAGTGSGIIWNGNGYVVTNYHIIGQHKYFEVTLKNGKTVKASFIGGDPRKDVALLKIRNSKAVAKFIPSQAIEVSNSKQLQVGQIAIAIGNPFGLDETLTEGVVSALDREIFGYGGVEINGMIQTDASINPGNSGGPLIDSRGRLIGMNTMIYSQSGGFSGIGFAIPSNTIVKVVNQLIKHGKIIAAGIGIIPVPDHVAAQAGVDGVIIAKVVRGMPASKAGLRGMTQTRNGQYRVGDIIVGINGHKIKDYNDLYQILDKTKVGQKVTLTIQHGNKRKSVKVTTVSLQ
ncbi:MAG: trypsin-like peptidase domain-containing protein [Coxiellaceae bacterium]|nr:trypsin-like peptidase domain-containing protein [Coxiellaceae bacterium]